MVSDYEKCYFASTTDTGHPDCTCLNAPYCLKETYRHCAFCKTAEEMRERRKKYPPKPYYGPTKTTYQIDEEE